MTVGDILNIEPYDYLIFPHDSKFKVKSGSDGTVLFESTDQTDALSTFEYCRDQMGTSGKTTWIKNFTTYPFSAKLAFNTASHSLQKWKGMGDWFGGKCRLMPSNDTPILEFNGNTTPTGGAYGINWEGVYLSHSQSGYTSSLVNILDHTIELGFRDIRAYSSGNYKGNVFALKCTTGTPSQYKLSFENINSDGFENLFYVDNQCPVVGGNNSITSIFFDKIFAWNCKHVAKIEGVSNAQFLAPHWSNVIYQYSSSNPLTTGEAVYDYASSLSTFIGKMVNCTTWDFPSDVNLINMGSSCEIMALNCNQSNRAGGAGAAKFKQLDYYTFATGETSVASTLTRNYTITHNLGKIPKHIDLSVQNTDTNAIIPYTLPYDLKTTTTFGVRFTRPPPLPNLSGDTNLKFSWRVYA